MLLFSELPLEVGTAILSYVTPNDLLSVSLASKGMQSYVKGNTQLHRQVYLNYFDRPEKQKKDASVDWEQELTDFRRFRSLCHSQSTHKSHELDFVARLLKKYLGVAPETVKGSLSFGLEGRTYRNAGHLARLIYGRRNYDGFFCQSFLFDRMRHAAALLTGRSTATTATASSTGSGSSGASSSSSTTPSQRTRPAPLAYPPTPQARHQTSAELHCLLGAVLLKCFVTSDHVADVYPYAVSKVYDMREYQRASLWGPFMADGSGNVDWEKLEAIMIVLRYNILKKGFFRYSVISAYWNNTFQGSSPGSYRPLVGFMDNLPDDSVPLDAQDPYGVTGTWMRLVSFLDYSDFFGFNFPDEGSRYDVPDNVPKPLFESEEELRMIVMRIKVTKIEWPNKQGEGEGEASERNEDQNQNNSLEVNDGEYDNTHPDFPIVHFRGASHSIDHPWDENANSGLYGTVRTTREGQIRWTTFSTFGGEPRWRSEGIQVGGRRSGRGVLGNWFTSNYDRQGPCGPTAFWKVHNKDRGAGAGTSTGTPNNENANANGNANVTAFPGGNMQSMMYLLNNNNTTEYAQAPNGHGSGLRGIGVQRPSGPTTRATTASASADRTTPGAAGPSTGPSNRPSSSPSSSSSDPDDGVFEGANEEDEPPISLLPTFQEPRRFYAYFELPMGSFLEAQIQMVDQLGSATGLWGDGDSDDDDGPFEA